MNTMNATADILENGDVFNWGISFDQNLWLQTVLPEIARLIFWIVFTIIAITLIIPAASSTSFIATMYGGAILIWLCEKRRNFRGGYGRIEQDEEWRVIKKYYRLISKMWHGYRLVGYEHQPDIACVYVTYHGTACVEGLYLASYISRNFKFPTYTLTNTTMLQLKGLKRFHEVICMCSLTKEECVQYLEEGNNIFVAPGGLAEAQLADRNYQVNWKGKTGFAKIALDANVPIVPHFLRNVNEAFWVPWFLIPFVRGRWAPKKIQCIPAIGALPVKLTSFLGPPIYPDEGMDEAAFAKKVEETMQDFIYAHQRIPGSRIIGLLERISGYTLTEKKKKKPVVYEIV